MGRPSRPPVRGGQLHHLHLKLGHYPLLAWLRTILANTMKDFLRRHLNHGANLHVSLQQSVEDSSARLEKWIGDGEMDPGQKVLRQEQVLRLAAALSRLPEDQRLAVELRHLQNFSLAGHLPGDGQYACGRGRAAAAWFTTAAAIPGRGIQLRERGEHAGSSNPSFWGAEVTQNQ